MIIAFNLFAFVDYVENGGSVKKLSLIQSQGKNLSPKTKRKYVKHTDRGTTYSG